MLYTEPYCMLLLLMVALTRWHQEVFSDVLLKKRPPFSSSKVDILRQRCSLYAFKNFRHHSNDTDTFSSNPCAASTTPPPASPRRATTAWRSPRPRTRLGRPRTLSSAGGIRGWSRRRRGCPPKSAVRILRLFL